MTTLLAFVSVSLGSGDGSPSETLPRLRRRLWSVRPPVEITVVLPGDVALTLARIPAGTFTMGSPTTEWGRAPDETQHTVTLSRDYYLGRTEVTQTQWHAVMGSNPSTASGNCGLGDDYPVCNVSWDDICGGATGSTCAASSFVGTLNRLLAATSYRLPTEAEWEYAARGGTTSEFSFAAAALWDKGCGAFPEAQPFMWWCGHTLGSRTSKRVAQKRANPYGLFDMHGNLWEWVGDWYGPYPTAAESDPQGPASGSARVMRGGGWDDYAMICRSAHRDYVGPGSRDGWNGFRVAMAP